MNTIGSLSGLGPLPASPRRGRTRATRPGPSGVGPVLGARVDEPVAAGAVDPTAFTVGAFFVAAGGALVAGAALTGAVPAALAGAFFFFAACTARRDVGPRT